ncbi:hypothetical protein M5K25_025603 [Dendrobium thyrsiflorum]|uniref:Uncharacterized protein n=1 Tax=Dendrobium thyrsiflorum TaxID=117978 RepID=A0ABD0UA45_DENTH
MEVRISGDHQRSPSSEFPLSCANNAPLCRRIFGIVDIVDSAGQAVSIGDLGVLLLGRDRAFTMEIEHQNLSIVCYLKNKSSCFFLCKGPMFFDFGSLLVSPPFRGNSRSWAFPPTLHERLSVWANTLRARVKLSLLLCRGSNYKSKKEPLYQRPIKLVSEHDLGPMTTKKVDVLEERIEGEVSQLKAAFEVRISLMEDMFYNIEEMMKKVLDLHVQPTASKERTPIGGNANSINRRDVMMWRFWGKRKGGNLLNHHLGEEWGEVMACGVLFGVILSGA